MNIYLWDLHLESNLNVLEGLKNKELIKKTNLYNWLIFYIKKAIEQENKKEKWKNFKKINIYYLWDLIMWKKDFAWTKSKKNINSFTKNKDDFDFMQSAIYGMIEEKLVENFWLFFDFYLLPALDEIIWLNLIEKINNHFILWNHELLIHDYQQYQIFKWIIKLLNNKLKKHWNKYDINNYLIENKNLIKNWNEIFFWNIWYSPIRMLEIFDWCWNYNEIIDVIENLDEVLNYIVDIYFWANFLKEHIVSLKITNTRNIINKLWLNFLNKKQYFNKIKKLQLLLKEIVNDIKKNKNKYKNVNIYWIDTYLKMIDFLLSKKINFYLKKESKETNWLYFLVFIAAILQQIEFIYNLILNFKQEKISINKKEVIINRLMHFWYNLEEINKKIIYKWGKEINHWSKKLNDYFNKWKWYMLFEINLIKYLQTKYNKKIILNYYHWHIHKNIAYKILDKTLNINYYVHSLWYWPEWIFENKIK